MGKEAFVMASVLNHLVFLIFQSAIVFKILDDKYKPSQPFRREMRTKLVEVSPRL